jgi:hypothetical protein
MNNVMQFEAYGWLDIELEAPDGSLRTMSFKNAASDNLASAAASALAQQSTGIPYQIRLGSGAHWATELDEINDVGIQGQDGDLSQFFIQNQTDNVTISYILAGLKRLGTSAGNVTMRLYPAGTDVLIVESSPVSFNGISSAAYDWRKFEFPTPTAIAPGNYRMQLWTDVVYSAGVTELQWGAINSNPYASGDMRKLVAGSWVHVDADPNMDAAFRAVIQTHDQMSALVGSTHVLPIDGFSKSGRYVARFLSVFPGEAEGSYVGHASLEDEAGTVLAISTVAINKSAAEILRIYWNTEVVP